MPNARDGMLCKLDGRGYELDLSSFAFASMDPTRQGVDQGAGAGSSSLSNEVVWRRVRENWVGGSGQEYADLEGEDESSSVRFHNAGIGCEPFTRRELTMRTDPRISMFRAHEAAWTDRIDGGIVVSGTNDVVNDLFMAGDATTPSTIVMTSTRFAYSVECTSTDSVVLWSTDTATEAGKRLELIYGGTAGNYKLRLKINTTLGATTHNITVESVAFALTDYTRMLFAVRAQQNGANIDYEFARLDWDVHTLPDALAYRNANGILTQFSAGSVAGTLNGAGGSLILGHSYDAATGALAASAQVVTQPIFGAYVCVQANRTDFALGAGAKYFELHFVDGNGWRAGTTDFDWSAAQQSVSSGVTGTIVVTTIFNSDDNGFWTPYFLHASPEDKSWTTSWNKLYLVNRVGIYRLGLDSTTGRILGVEEVVIFDRPSSTRNTVGSTHQEFAPYGAGFFFLMETNGTGKNMHKFDGDTVSAVNAGAWNMVAAAGSRILCSINEVLSEMSAAGTGTTIYTHHNSLFRWGGALGAPRGIYAWGTDGSDTEFFRLPINDATGAIGAPIPAGSLPAGSQVQRVVFHEGVFLIGTKAGLKLALLDADGSLVFGGTLRLGPVEDIIAHERFAYVIANDAEGELPTVDGDTNTLGGPLTTHLFKIDLSRFTEPDSLIPAYTRIPSASWLPVSTVAATTAAKIQPTRLAMAQRLPSEQPQLYVASELGVADFTADDGESAYRDTEIDLGWFTYGIGEMLAFDSLTVECDPLPVGSAHSVTVHVDTADEDSVITATSTMQDPVFTVRHDGDVRARRFRVRLVLGADNAVQTAPVVRQVVLRCVPSPQMSDEMLLPIMLADQVETEHGQLVGQDVWEEFSHLMDLRRSRRPVPLRIGAWETTVRVEGVEIRPGGLGGDNGLTGYTENDEWLAGRWNVRVVTVA